MSNLAIIESTLYGQVVDVGVQYGSHLRLLDRADFALREHDEDGNILLPSQSVNSRRTSITTRRANNSQMLPIPSFSSLVLALEEVLEQIAQKLQRNILERKSRPMEQFQQMQILALIQRHQRRHIRRAERRIAAVDNALEIRRGNFRRRDVQREDLQRQLLEREIFPCCLPVGRESGDFFGDEETAVGRETFEDYGFEGELAFFSVSSCAASPLRVLCGGVGMGGLRRRSRLWCSGSAERRCGMP